MSNKQCPRCGHPMNRLLRNTLEKFFSLFGVYPFRCKMCWRRYYRRFTPAGAVQRRAYH